MENKDYVLKFGKYQGKPLEEIPLLYLDWLLTQDWLSDDTIKAVDEYLGESLISRELDRQLDGKERKWKWHMEGM